MTNLDAAPPGLPEYRDNPFIAALPPLWSTSETYEHLRLLPHYDSAERQYPDHVRPHCIMRLFRYFEPLEQHLTLADRFGMLLRQGYLGRNPNQGDYQRQLQNSVARMESGSLLAKRFAVPNSAVGFALLGDSGIGKSTAMERTLAQYPQTIYHDKPFSLHQVTWLKVECPQKGGPNQLCINFFGELDRVLGTNYLDKYGSSSRTLGLAMQRMAHLASIHALGALIVDEIQHLLHTRGMDAEDILNFLVTLVNTIGVPVIVIGTQNAVAVLQGKFRQARRASGIGSMIWERMPYGKKWNHFVERLWQYQWTREFTPLDDGLRAVLHEESQGIIDVVVKLFMLAQMKAIRLRAVRHRPEALDAALFRQVVTEDFQLIRPMLDACRRNDREALNAFDDLLPFREHVVRIFGVQSGDAPHDEPPQPQAPDVQSNSGDADDASGAVRAALAALGVAPDVVELMLKEALAEHPSVDALQLVAAIGEKLKAPAERTKQNKSRRFPKPTPGELPSNDLRRIAAEGKQRNLAAYDALKAAGAIKALPIAA